MVLNDIIKNKYNKVIVYDQEDNVGRYCNRIRIECTDGSGWWFQSTWSDFLEGIDMYGDMEVIHGDGTVVKDIHGDKYFQILLENQNVFNYNGEIELEF